MNPPQVRSAIERGDLLSAQAASRSAYNLNRTGIIVGVVITVLAVLFVLAANVIPRVLLASSKD